MSIDRPNNSLTEPSEPQRESKIEEDPDQTSGIDSDGSQGFSEGIASKGSLGEILGPELMPLLIKFARAEE